MLTEGPMNSICGTPDELAAWKKGYNAGIAYRHEDDKRRERIATAAFLGLLTRTAKEFEDIVAIDENVGMPGGHEWLAGTAVELADALIVALEEEK